MEYSLSEWLILSPNFPTWWHTEHLPVSGSFLQRRRGTHRWNYIYQNVCTDAASNEQAAAIYCAVTAIWKELLFVDEVCVKAGSDGFESLASWCITNNIEMEKFDLKSSTSLYTFQPCINYTIINQNSLHNFLLYLFSYVVLEKMIRKNRKANLFDYYLHRILKVEVYSWIS